MLSGLLIRSDVHTTTDNCSQIRFLTSVQRLCLIEFWRWSRLFLRPCLTSHLLPTMTIYYYWSRQGGGLYRWLANVIQNHDVRTYDIYNLLSISIFSYNFKEKDRGSYHCLSRTRNQRIDWIQRGRLRNHVLEQILFTLSTLRSVTAPTIVCLLHLIAYS